MKLREIKPGMVIHCKTREEANQLVDLTDIGKSYKNYWRIEKENTCYSFRNNFWQFSPIDWYIRNGYTITEFSDLIDDKLSAEEVLKIYGEIRECNGIICDDCRLNKSNTKCGKFLCSGDYIKDNTEEIIEICKQYKVDHEKSEPKEPTLYWHTVVRIIDTSNNKKAVVKEVDVADGKRETAENVLKEYLKSIKETEWQNYIAVIENVCRVKVVE